MWLFGSHELAFPLKLLSYNPETHTHIATAAPDRKKKKKKMVTSSHRLISLDYFHCSLSRTPLHRSPKNVVVRL